MFQTTKQFLNEFNWRLANFFNGYDKSSFDMDYILPCDTLL